MFEKNSHSIKSKFWRHTHLIKLNNFQEKTYCIKTTYILTEVNLLMSFVITTTNIQDVTTHCTYSMIQYKYTGTLNFPKHYRVLYANLPHYIAKSFYCYKSRTHLGRCCSIKNFPHLKRLIQVPQSSQCFKYRNDNLISPKL